MPLLNTVHQGDFVVQAKRLNGARFDVVIADPPYNIGKDFGNDSDRQDLPSYLEWSKQWLSLCFDKLADDGIIYVYGLPEILAHVAVNYPIENQRWLVWHYTNKTVPSSRFWQRSYESILCLWKPGGKRPALEIDQIREPYTEQYLNCAGKIRQSTQGRFSKGSKKTVYAAHKNGALPRDVIKVPALAGGAGRKQRWFFCHTCDAVYPATELKSHQEHEIWKHPTQKPMDLTQRLLRSKINGKGGKALIPFAGSGSECAVAKSLGIDFFATEINERYVELAKNMLESLDRHVPVSKIDFSQSHTIQ